jgi:glycine cleavage system aminomethyltransferase T
MQSAYSATGTELEFEVTVEYERKRAAARVAKLPFYDPPQKRALGNG